VGAALDSASYELSKALEELRELARGLHPAVLSDRGLAAALRGVVDRAQIPGAELDVQVEGRLDEQVEVALFYVAAESLTNVAKYAQATSVHVRLRHTDDEAVVEIADNGIGGASLDGGSGLRGLRDRVESLDGTFRIVSEQGQGTMIRVVIPCHARVPA
jgi:signal transduction histidine kinase